MKQPKLNKKRKRPEKGELTSDSVLTLEDFQMGQAGNGSVLLPIMVDIDGGIIKRRRLKAAEVRAILADNKQELADHCEVYGKALPGYRTFEDFKALFDDYNTFFIKDDDQGMYLDSPLNIDVRRPAIILFMLARDNWTFTEKRQISFHFDRDDLARNCHTICTLAGKKILMVENKFLSRQELMTYDLHVTVEQTDGQIVQKTDIIIDPGMDNDDGSGGPGGGLPPNNNGG